MNRFLRILTAAALTAGLVGPFSMGTSFAQTQAAAPAAQTTGTVTGTIHDSSGAPVANANVRLAGATTLTATTDAQGTFTFNGVAPGIYSFTATKAGYTTATESTVSVLGGQTQTLTITMPVLTFTSLRTIAQVRSAGRGTFNTTPASVNVVTSQTFQDQAQPQVMRILNQTPGIVASLPQTSANGSVPGAITFPNIRGALSFETASLIDGHPVSVGTYGDYVTTFLNAYALGGVEVVKGPGADSPEVNYAIGGTVNFRTKDPTYKTSGNFTIGYGSHGSAVENFELSDTVGRLGYVVDYAENYDPGAFNNYQASFVPGGNNTYLNYNPATGAGTYVGYNDSQAPVSGTASKLYNSYGTVACCFTLNANYDSKAELVKLRYKLSGATSATFTYLGSQTYADQNANTSSQTPGTFNPGAKYTGPLTPGSSVTMTNIHPGGSDIENNNEPILEGDLHTTIGNDSLLARYYHASIYRLVHEGPAAPWTPEFMTLNVQGTNGQSATSANISGTQNVAFFDFYNQQEIDKLGGVSLEYNHPFAGGNDVLTLSADKNSSTTSSYTESPSLPFSGPLTQATIGTRYSINVPNGSKQDFGTYLARIYLRPTAKLGVTWANYLNTYSSTYPVACAPLTFAAPNPKSCLPDGSGFTFATTNRSHYDPRFALDYRANGNTSLRFAMGSSIAPPYLYLLSGLNGAITYRTGSTYATQNVNSGTLLPETAWGYDLGGDYRFRDGVTTVSGDVYLTNLYNHFITQTYNSGTTCTTSPCPAGGVPLYYTSNVNLNNSRFEGIELSIRRTPTVGFGYVAQGSVQRGYVYNLPACFYSNTPSNCGAYNTNLAIIPNMNFTGGALGAPAGLGYGGFSNQNIPYLQAYGQLSYRFENGIFAMVGDTVYGKNNALNAPPFQIVNASVRFPFANGLALQLTGDNLTNQYNGLFPTQGAGVGIPLANGTIGATQLNVLGPRTLRVLLIKNFGEGSSAP